MCAPSPTCSPSCKATNCRHGSKRQPTPTCPASSASQHLERDLDAVTAGLSQPWNSGVVEGHVNRIKMLERQMFGRAGFELLRKRVLLYS
ncbi:hypothetical protein [Streptomyces sp. NPDC048560]|uniref:hypothetical protein n=1 Tax=Streptomyces sp. NPDC048560 TaxID=3155488 RepID=UPI003436D7BF